MDRQREPDLAGAISGALDWWRDAGIDCAFIDEPQSWLEAKSDEAPPAQSAEPIAARPKPESAAPPSSPSIDLAAMPSELGAFREWWLSEPSLADGPPSRRLAPRGPENPELMIVVAEPEAEDRDRLLSARQGRFLSAVLRAAGLDETACYFASVLPRALPGADWAQVEEFGFGQILTRHIALCRPKRLAVFGANILPLLGHDPPQGPAVLRIFNQEDTSISMLAARNLAALMEQPRWKQTLWRTWLEWREA